MIQKLAYAVLFFTATLAYALESNIAAEQKNNFYKMEAVRIRLAAAAKANASPTPTRCPTSTSTPTPTTK